MTARMLPFAALLLANWCAVATTLAVTLPFTEDFDDDARFWLAANGAALVDYQPTGGPDDSSYVSTSFSFIDAAEGDTPVIFRGRNDIGPASDGAFLGNWIEANVGKISAQVRHNAPMPLNFYTRVATPFNFPGALAIDFVPVLPNTWTEIEVAIDPNNPQFVTFEGQSFADVFRNVGRVQFGVANVPAALAGVGSQFTFELDQVALSVPEPTGAMLAASIALLLGTRRRREKTFNLQRTAAARSTP